MRAKIIQPHRYIYRRGRGETQLLLLGNKKMAPSLSYAFLLLHAVDRVWLEHILVHVHVELVSASELSKLVS